ncbi:nitrilase-related carbon-nitrogen hydrolase [Antarcticirhabdus aurantiaca]|uniref:Hydrolase n=1 Tax=Antarcticirhabdus aurantiaca TaxID=2606717 RepID=A0ACD4NN43_9HYPH|nr:nitrilase-related carbon-nitrogen hydrolase [Antarcticirhabdus aurantiaca]WAJ28066.1 hydrolase [Jeongeuplla avenae]
MRLALFQLDASNAAGGEAGLGRIGALMRAAREAGAGLAHLPELALPGYGAGAEALRETAMRAPEILARLEDLVAETGVALALGLPVLDGGAVLNAAILLRPNRERVLYAKRFLYGDYERAAFSAGAAVSPVVEVAGFRVGLLVCFDVEFPETVRELALAGADLVLVPTALPESAGARFIARSLVPTRAFENSLFLSYADWCGADAAFRYQGLSAIVGPDGIPLAQAGEAGAEMLLADLDPAAFEAPRAANNYLGELLARRSG